MNIPDSITVVSRFFEALRRLKADRRIRGKKTFTDRYAINRWNFNTCEKQPERDIFQPAWLTYLARDYGVSAEWLLLGTGNFYRTAPDAPSPSGIQASPDAPFQSEGRDTLPPEASDTSEKPQNPPIRHSNRRKRSRKSTPI